MIQVVSFADGGCLSDCSNRTNSFGRPTQLAPPFRSLRLRILRIYPTCPHGLACAHEDGGCAHEVVDVCARRWCGKIRVCARRSRRFRGVCARSSCAQNGPGNLGGLGRDALATCASKTVVRRNLDLNSPASHEARAGQVLKLQTLATNWAASKVSEFTSI
jgi:hypothetical protein